MNEQMNNNTINTQPEINQNPQIEQQPVQPQYNQPNNNKKSNNTLVILLVIVVLALVAALIFIMMNKKDSSNDKDTNKENNTIENTNDNQTTDNTTEAKEVELSNPESYRYLIDGLENIEWCSYIPIEQYLNISNLSNETKLGTAIAGLGDKESYVLSDVENEVRKIYGKNTNINHQSFSSYKYDENNKKYIKPEGIGCSLKPILYQSIDKVTQKDNSIYLYVSFGYSYMDNDHKMKLCYDYVSNDEIKNYYKDNTEIKTECINVENDNYNVSYLNQYIKDNKDKFTKYKYTFEKEDNNYIIKGLEKIN